MTEETTVTTTTDRAPNLEEQAARLISRSGGDVAAVTLLMSENRDYRARIRELERAAPPEGATVLSGDDARAWEAYRALGAPEAVQGIVAERDRLAGEVAAAARREALREAAAVAGYRAPVLERLAGEVEIAVEGEGENRRAVVRREGQAPVPLTDYAAQEWSDFLPALTVAPTPPGARDFVRQDSGTGAGSLSPIEAAIAANRAAATAPNALTKQ